MAQREEILNGELGRQLIARHPAWNEKNVHIDSTRTIRGHNDFKIDLLVENPGGQPVAIEAKFDAAKVGATLRSQVDDRIGLTIRGSGSVIEAGISVVYPAGLTGSGLVGASLRYAVHQLGDDGSVKRWPEEDEEWIDGTVDELADAVEVVSLSEKRIREGEQLLSDGVYDASSRLDSLGKGTPFAADLAAALHQEAGEQTTRMATAIVVNAFVFHYAIEGQEGIPDVASATGKTGFLKSRVLKNWDAVLAVNYWPVFSIAKEIVATIPTRLANPLLDKADEVAEDLLKVGATTFHDLAARMFQTLISDRKFLATFYTLPESACMLAELAVSRLDVDWNNEGDVEALKIADFACGTGTLLSAAQRAIYRRLRRAGLADEDWHKLFMENVLLGTDIMPSAAHLTASMLSSAHPAIGYDKSLVRVLPYGIDKELSKLRGTGSRTPYIGALDLRMAQFGRSIFTTGGIGHQVAIGGKRMTAREAEAVDIGRDFPVEHESFDLVIMNPPFTRPTNHESSSVPVPSFAGFDTSKKEQAAMSKSLSSQEHVFGHGNAGLASNFMDLAHEKLAPGGVLALVLPFSFATGQAWIQARQALAEHYSDIHVVSIATEGTTDRSFSADTGMAECLVVARKERPKSSDTVRYTNLEQRPRTLVEAHEFAKRARDGDALEGALTDGGAAGIRDSEIGHAMMAIGAGRLLLPRESRSRRIPVTIFSALGTRGLLHRDISGAAPRGPFDIRERRAKGAPTYPALWKHRAGRKDGDRERRFEVEPDTYGEVRKGARQAAAEVWATTASRLHHSLDFQLNSQSLAVCVTPQPSLGGRAWPNILPRDQRYEAPLVLWGNSTLGLMLFWWQGSRQQQGRAILTITKIPDLLTLDASTLDSKQFATCERVYERFRNRVFLPANEAYRDDARKELDAALFKILKLPKSLLGSLDVLRLKWCCEPSVHGGKSTKPDAA